MNVKGVFSCCNEAFSTGNFGVDCNEAPRIVARKSVLRGNKRLSLARLPRSLACNLLIRATILRDCQQSIFGGPSITRNCLGCGVGVIEGMGRGNPLHVVRSFSLIRHLRFEKGTGPRKLSQRLLVLFQGSGEKWPIAVWRVPRNDSNSLFVSKAANAHSFDLNFYSPQSTSCRAGK